MKLIPESTLDWTLIITLGTDLGPRIADAQRATIKVVIPEDVEHGVGEQHVDEQRAGRQRGPRLGRGRRRRGGGGRGGAGAARRPRARLPRLPRFPSLAPLARLAGGAGGGRAALHAWEVTNKFNLHTSSFKEK